MIDEVRGKGVGKQLMDSVRDLARRWGASSILLGVGLEEPARLFYEKNGFRPMGNELFFCPLDMTTPT